MVVAGLVKINPVTKTGQRLYMIHMLLLPFLPILALIIQNSYALHDTLEYQVLSHTQIDSVSFQQEEKCVFFYKLHHGWRQLCFETSAPSAPYT